MGYVFLQKANTCTNIMEKSKYRFINTHYILPFFLLHPERVCRFFPFIFLYFLNHLHFFFIVNREWKKNMAVTDFPFYSFYLHAQSVMENCERFSFYIFRAFRLIKKHFILWSEKFIVLNNI